MAITTQWKSTVVSSGNVNANLTFYDKTPGRDGKQPRLLVLWDSEETECSIERAAQPAASVPGSLRWDVEIGEEPVTFEFMLTRKKTLPRHPSIAAIILDWNEPQVLTKLEVFDWEP